MFGPDVNLEPIADAIAQALNMQPVAMAIRFVGVLMFFAIIIGQIVRAAGQYLASRR